MISNYYVQSWRYFKALSIPSLQMLTFKLYILIFWHPIFIAEEQAEHGNQYQ